MINWRLFPESESETEPDEFGRTGFQTVHISVQFCLISPLNVLFIQRIIVYSLCTPVTD